MTAAARVLVIDDDAAIRDLVEIVLSGGGYDVCTAEDGVMGLDLARKLRPDLILLDMRMPGMDGWTFARRYRQEPGSSAPIIVLTAARDAAARSAEIAADGYLAKPFNVTELLALVGQHAPRS